VLARGHLIKLNTLARVLAGTPRVAARVLAGTPRVAARVLQAARALRGQDHLAKGQLFIAVQAPKDIRPRRGCSCHALRYLHVIYRLESL
jgi:hypothetical protein